MMGPRSGRAAPGATTSPAPDSPRRPGGDSTAGTASCAAWSDGTAAADVAAYFTDDAVYHNIPMAAITGREEIADFDSRMRTSFYTAAIT